MGNNLRHLDLEKITGGRWAGEPPGMPPSGAGIDSRKIRGGELFVAIPTEKDDGHRYLEDARAKGAVAALVQRADGTVPLPQLCVRDTLAALRAIAAAHRERLKCEVIAVAGSYGKTTVKELLALLLGEAAHATIANLNNCIGVPLNVLGIDDSRHRWAVIEAGIDRPGEMQLISNLLRPRHVILTALSQKHAKFFPSHGELWAEKLHIADHVLEQGGRLVLAEELLQNPLLRRWKSCALSPIFDRKFLLPVQSAGFRENFALCLALLRHFGVGDEAIARRLRNWKAIPLRGQIFRHRRLPQTYFIDCYNSDLLPLLDSAREFRRIFGRENRLFIIGGMSDLGRYSARAHFLAGLWFPLSSGDTFFLLGEATKPLMDALRLRRFPEKNIHFFMAKNELETALTNFHGAIYLKASRGYALETLIDFDSCVLCN
jgi:UDP-N-acetylmuramyl pentapeptide synthase